MRFCIAVWPATPFLLFLAVLWCCTAWGATPYKTYVVKKYKNWDILCDPYTVQKDDCVWELLRRRGHIVEWDTAWFTALLRRLNPHIKNVDKIYPGQQILIPLKKRASAPAVSNRCPVDTFGSTIQSSAPINVNLRC